jgi:choline/glycine/proline betaine transport protein
MNIVLIFVTPSDSGSLVIDIITAGGNTDPPKIQRIFWAGSAPERRRAEVEE